MSISVQGTTITITTPRLRARFEGAQLVALTNAAGQALVERGAGAPAGLALVFSDGGVEPLGLSKYARISAVRVSDTVAHVYVEDVEGDAALRLATDDEGRLLVEPSGQTARQGLAGVRWTVGGIGRGQELVAPLWQGVQMDLEHPLLATVTYEGRPPALYSWPFQWEAALTILQGREGGWSVSAHDTLQMPKRLWVGDDADPRALAFETQAHGPWHGNTAVGSLAWIIDVHEGGWQTAAGAYRAWWRRAYDYDRLRALRPAWADDIRFTLQWCPNDPAILDAMARVIDPHQVLIHVPQWRADPYDVNYPEYNPSAEGRAFIAYAREKGFYALPHFNYFAIDPNHPAFPRLMSFVARDATTRRLMGWRWVAPEWVAFPQGHTLLQGMQGENTMAYIHAGSSAWRHLLVEKIAAAMAQVQTPGLFLDQTLCTYNTDNALIENLSMTQGMVALTRELCALEGRPIVAGEGLNEMNVQYQTFAQTHLMKSHQYNNEHFAEIGTAPVGQFLYGDLCRTMGYTGLGGENEASAVRLRVHEELGALPTLTIRSAEQITRPTPAVQRVLDLALSRG